MSIAKIGKDLFQHEAEELLSIKERIGNDFENAVNLILSNNGKVVVCGIGKSGIVGKKIASSLSSTGTSAIFVNAAEGLHGDLGMISSSDIVILISNSGASDEVLATIPSIKKIGAKIIAFTGKLSSPLANNADIIIDIGVSSEGCPLNLAPFASSTSALVMGDAIAATLMKLRGFKPNDFAVYHPGGNLGRRLLTKVNDVMISLKDIAIVDSCDDMEKIIIELTSKKIGAVCVFDNNKMVGIITEGDIRRVLLKKDEFFKLIAKDIMTNNFSFVNSQDMAIDALKIMENRDSPIAVLPVFEFEKLVGIVRIHDLIGRM